MSIKTFKNPFFITPIFITLIVELLIALMIIGSIIILYKRKNRLIFKVNKWYKYSYPVVFLIPLILIVSIQYAPKKIYTLQDFEKIEYNLDGKYMIMNDLDFSKRVDNTEYDEWCYTNFSGSLDGNNHTIKNVTQPLFHCVAAANIKNLNIINVDIKARYAEYTGVVADRGNATIINVHVKGKVTGYKSTGGIIGEGYRSTIKKSSFEGEVHGLNYVGGLVGADYNGVTIEKSYVIGNITGQDEVGGLIGDAGYNIINTSFTIGSVSGRSNVGGLGGFVQLTIENSYSKMSVSGTDYGTGGITGQNWHKTFNSFALGDVNGVTHVGGISGTSRVLQNSFSIGDITSTENEAYGISSLSEDTSITNAYGYEDQMINGEPNDTEPIVTKTQLMDINWYKDTMHFDPSIWDLSVVEEGYYPILKDVPNQELTKIE